VLLLAVEPSESLAVMDPSAITAIRTAAVSGVATRLLARQDAGDLAISHHSFGCPRGPGLFEFRLGGNLVTWPGQNSTSGGASFPRSEVSSSKIRQPDGGELLGKTADFGLLLR
jgi:hypothetical protein